MSVIVPSINWIYKNCLLKTKLQEKLNILPRKITFILKLDNYNAIAKKELISDLDGLSIRFHNNWFNQVIYILDKPVITTSINVTWKPHLIDIKNSKNKIKDKVNYFINDEILKDLPSKIISLVDNKVILK